MAITRLATRNCIEIKKLEGHNMKEADFATRAIHSGESFDPATRAHNTPIYQTATFIFDHATELVGAYDNPFDTFFLFQSRQSNRCQTARQNIRADWW
jgi:O-acetylhomoserine/O-acetylserine sulfhydrylase-like pyridoxal-dependent enzyme